MTENQQAAYTVSVAVSALIEALGMHAENEQRKALGYSMTYGEEAFQDLINRSGIHHNAVCQFFHPYLDGDR